MSTGKQRWELDHPGVNFLFGEDEVVPSATNAVKPQRDKLIASGVMEECNGEYIFIQDFLFSSPSTAGTFVLGLSANGRVGWKDGQGQTLIDVYRVTEETESTDAHLDVIKH